MSDATDVLDQIDSRTRQLVDTHNTETYANTLQQKNRNGHIPTAINLSTKDLLGADGLWKSPEEITHLTGTAGIDLEQPMTAYCNDDITTTTILFDLQRANLSNISNYDGSWNE